MCLNHATRDFPEIDTGSEKKPHPGANPGTPHAPLPPMRAAAAIFLLASACQAQFRSTVPLVVAPTTVRDSKGQFVDGLTEEDLILYDNNVPQKIRMDWTVYPIDLVVAVQTSTNSGAVIDKLGGSGILFTQLLAGDAGESAILSFSDEVKVHQDFTADPDRVSHALRMLRKEGDSAHTLDALLKGAAMLEARQNGRRRILLVIGEKRDRSSRAKLREVVERIQRLNVAVYWLTYSPFLEPFTVKPKTAEDTKPIDERIKTRKCDFCADPDTTPVPPDLGPGGLIYGLGELFRLSKPDLSELFTRTTGGRTMNFLKKGALEEAIQLVGAEVHRQYILNFSPKPDEAGTYHRIQVEVKDRPDLRVKSREGYWSLN